jgi:dipeptidyl aminopeptidase/acylaminoacyl peptidase
MYIRTDYRLILTKDRPDLSSERADPSGTVLARTSSNSKLHTPSSRQRVRYKITNRNSLKENVKEEEKLVAGPRWAPDTKTEAD